MEKADNTPYGLSAGVSTTRVPGFLKWPPNCKAGVVWANTYNRFDPASPFGGYKESGFGREGGRQGLRLRPAHAMKRLPITKTPKVYVGGAFIRSESGRTFPAGRFRRFPCQYSPVHPEKTCGTRSRRRRRPARGGPSGPPTTGDRFLPAGGDAGIAFPGDGRGDRRPEGSSPAAAAKETAAAIDRGSQGFVYVSAQPATLTTAAVPQSFAPINLPFSGPLSATYQDGFGLVNQVGTNQWWQSDLLDLTTWGPLAFSSADSQPDNVIALGSLKREIWILKENDSEIWINAGLPNFAFQRLEGVFIETGIAAPYSLAKCGERLAFVAQNEEGCGIIVATNGYDLERISTHYIEDRIQAFPTVNDAVGYAYQQNGHLFYVISFDAGNETWSYDFTASTQLGERAWHRRANFTTATGFFDRHLGNNHVYAYGKHVIGDYSSGNLYSLDPGQALDNGQQRRWVRSWRALAQPMEDPTRFDSLRIDMQTGIGVPAGTNPMCLFRISDDGGYNYRQTRFKPVGKTGETTRRVKFRRLGSTKRAKGLDRMFELSSTDVFDVCLIGAELE